MFLFKVDKVLSTSSVKEVLGDNFEKITTTNHFLRTNLVRTAERKVEKKGFSKASKINTNHKHTPNSKSLERA